MTIAPLDRKLLRDLWHLRGQALAIALVIAAGVALFVTMLGTMRSLSDTRDAYYEQYRFADIFAPVKRAPKQLSTQLAKIPGVAAVQTRILAAVTLDIPGQAEPATGQLISLADGNAPRLNDIALRSGRLPAPRAAGEVLISQAFAGANELGPGDTISAILNGRRQQLTIVGTALSPEFVYAISPGEIVPDDRRFGVIWMNEDALAAAFDLEEAFNAVAVKLLRGASERAVIDEIDLILAPYGGTGAFPREDQTSHFYLTGELDQLASFSRIIPPIFLGVAAFLLNIVISRLIATERQQIGLLKAFGYTDMAVAIHYAKLVLAITGAGTLLGLGAGTWLGQGLTQLYTQFFQFPFLQFRLQLDLFALATIIAISAALLATFTALRSTMRLTPAVAMAPPAPPSYRHSLLEHPALFARISQPNRMILRHIARWPIRAGLTVAGLSMAVALLITALFGIGSIEQLIHIQFDQTARQDATVTFFEPRQAAVSHTLENLPGVLAVEGFRTVPARLISGPRRKRVAITGYPQGTDLSRLLNQSLQPLALPGQGLMLTERLAAFLAVEPGDHITVSVMTGRRPQRQIRVAGLIRGYLGIGAYMELGALNRLMLEGPTLSGAHLLTDSGSQQQLYRALKDSPAVAGVSLRATALASLRDTLAQTLIISIVINSAFAGLIAFGVVYNSARIALSEQGRELASLRVLGFTRGEVTYILLGELALFLLVALPIGSLLGYGLAAAVVLGLDNDLYRLPLVVTRATYGYAWATVIFASIISSLIVARRIGTLDLVAVLKTRE
ncbi:MAG: ABC transporter permease [Alphaproteobacteria bacterium]